MYVLGFLTRPATNRQDSFSSFTYRNMFKRYRYDKGYKAYIYMMDKNSCTQYDMHDVIGRTCSFKLAYYKALGAQKVRTIIILSRC